MKELKDFLYDYKNQANVLSNNFFTFDLCSIKKLYFHNYPKVVM